MRHERWPRFRWRWLDSVQLITVLLVAIALVPSGAHLAELPNKLGLPVANYMIVQTLYSGWALFGVIVVGALVSAALHTYLVRANRTAFLWSAIAFCCIVGTQVVFWLFTFPMNALSENWTVVPPDLGAARTQWEYSHAVSACLNLAALVAVMISILTSRPFVSIQLLGAIERDVEARVARTRAEHSRSGGVGGPDELESRDGVAWDRPSAVPR